MQYASYLRATVQWKLSVMPCTFGKRLPNAVKIPLINLGLRQVLKGVWVSL